jgi:hypothetical protein
MTVIPPPVAALLELFEASLSDVRFADLDAKVLSALSAEVEAAAEGLAAKQAALDEARSALSERQNLLLQQAQRALAYARVYAENDFDLRAKLDAITLPRPARAPKRASAEASTTPRTDPEPTAEASEAVPEHESAQPETAPSTTQRKKKRDTALPATP